MARSVRDAVGVSMCWSDELLCVFERPSTRRADAFLAVLAAANPVERWDSCHRVQADTFRPAAKQRTTQLSRAPSR